MKKFLIFALALFVSLTTSCSVFKHINPKIEGKIKKETKYERIIITSTRLSGRYTMFDASSIKRFLNKIYEAKDITAETKFEPDFFIEFYDSNKKVATFKYIAGITDETQPNLIDEDGNRYYVDNSIEDEFIKRIMKKEMFKGAKEYYVSLLEDVIERIPKKGIGNNKVFIDINKDYMVTKYLTSVDMFNIFDSIKNNSVEIVDRIDKADYVVTIVTNTYNDTKVVANVVIKNKNNVVQRLLYEGNRAGDKITYFIKNK